MNENTLFIGSSGESVTYLQSILKLNDYFPILITGVFGPDTEYFVKKYQKDFNLLETGIITNTDISILESLLNKSKSSNNVLSYPTISEGSTGEYVTKVQIILTDKLYYTDSIDGIFDSELKLAVQTFQFINKLSPDAIVGPNTWSALIELYSPLSSCEDYTEVEDDINKYTVVSGDTLYSIAKKYDTTVDELKSINNLTSDTLSIGQELLLKETSNNDARIYTVVSGDTLYSIAKKYDTTVDELKTINNLTSDTLSIGQELLLKETSNNDASIYTVVSGDTLYSIAKKYDTTVDELKSINNLTSDILSIGQELIIENSTSDKTNTYIVVSGDTLYSISKKLGVSVSDLQTNNNLNTTLISIGQVLIY